MATSYTNTSGTIATTKITVQQLIDFAYRDNNYFAEQITPELVNAARQALYYDLINLTNKGVNLWALKYIVLGTLARQRELEMPDGVSDIREFNYRDMTRPTPIDDTSGEGIASVTDLLASYTFPANSSIDIEYENATPIVNFGFNSQNHGDTLTLQSGYRDPDTNVTTYTTRGTATHLVNGNTWAYAQIDATANSKYWRVLNNTASPITVRAVVLSDVQRDIPLARLNRDDYFNLPDKDRVGSRSLQYFFDRQLTPIANLWTVPNDDFQTYQLFVEYQLQDVGTLTNEIAVPDRWLPYIQAKLSHSLSMQLKNVDLPRIQMLKLRADELFLDASEEDRDKSPIYFAPNISHYTR